MGRSPKATTGSYTGKVLVVNYQAGPGGTSGSVRVYGSEGLVVTRAGNTTSFTISDSGFGVFLTREPDAWSQAQSSVSPERRSGAYHLPADWHQMTMVAGVGSSVMATARPIRIGNPRVTVTGKTVLVLDLTKAGAPLEEALKAIGVGSVERSRLERFMMQQISNGLLGRYLG